MQRRDHVHGTGIGVVIDPRAIIDPDARLGVDVEVGPCSTPPEYTPGVSIDAET